MLSYECGSVLPRARECLTQTSDGSARNMMASINQANQMAGAKNSPKVTRVMVVILRLPSNRAAASDALRNHYSTISSRL